MCHNSLANWKSQWNRYDYSIDILLNIVFLVSKIHILTILSLPFNQVLWDWTVLGIFWCQRKRSISVDIIRSAFSSYPFNTTAISFNGGKECTVLLDLVHQVINQINNANSTPIVYIPLIFYSPSPDNFEEEYEFIEKITATNELNFLQYSHKTINESLYRLKQDSPYLKAIVIGARNNDHKT